MFVMLLPVILAVLPWFPNTSLIIGAFSALGLQIVLSVFLSQIGRDLGKRKESSLFALWNGMPSHHILSYVNSPLEITTIKRYRAKLKILLPALDLPDERSEAKNPDRARGIYQSCADYLRERTRDKKSFPLIFSENINYGFRRNLWAMKYAAILIAMIAVCVSGLSVYLGASSDSPSLPISISCFLLNTLLLVWWIFRVNPSWVKIAGDAYAQRLFSALEIL